MICYRQFVYSIHAVSHVLKLVLCETLYRYHHHLLLLLLFYCTLKAELKQNNTHQIYNQ